TALGSDLMEARERAYAAADEINFRGRQIRRDIGWRELARSADGNAIQARAIARFGPEAVAAQLLQVYQRVLRA
ncbi:MAG: hypothetical protein ACOVRP_03215, partial [Gemmatimonas sp.]